MSHVSTALTDCLFFSQKSLMGICKPQVFGRLQPGIHDFRAVEQLKVAFTDGNFNPLSVTLSSSTAVETWLAVHMLSRFIEGAELCPVVSTQLEMSEYHINHSMCIYTGDSHSLD